MPNLQPPYKSHGPRTVMNGDKTFADHNIMLQYSKVGHPYFRWIFFLNYSIELRCGDVNPQPPKVGSEAIVSLEPAWATHWDLCKRRKILLLASTWQPCKYLTLETAALGAYYHARYFREFGFPRQTPDHFPCVTPTNLPSSEDPYITLSIPRFLSCS